MFFFVFRIENVLNIENAQINESNIDKSEEKEKLRETNRQKLKNIVFVCVYVFVCFFVLFSA